MTIVNAEGNTSTCFYVCIRVGNISGWRVDAHITLFKTYGRPPLQLLDEELSNELAILRDAFASTSIDGEFRNWVLLFTAQELPRRALLEIFGELRDCLFRVRNTLSQRSTFPSLKEGQVSISVLIGCTTHFQESLHW